MHDKETLLKKSVGVVLAGVLGVATMAGMLLAVFRIVGDLGIFGLPILVLPVLLSYIVVHFIIIWVQKEKPSKGFVVVYILLMLLVPIILGALSRWSVFSGK